MFRPLLVLAVFALIQEGTIPKADANDNPVIRALLREAIKKELSAKDTKEKGSHQGNTWIWFDNPPANLGADVSNLTFDNGRFTIEGRASGIVRFDHKVTTPIGNKTFGGQALVYLSFKASALAGERLTNSKVSIGRLEINQVRLRGDAARPFQGIVQEGVNLLVRHKKHDLERKLEEALNKTNLAGHFRAARPQLGSGLQFQEVAITLP